jgi:hypothetical protein
MFPSGAMAMEPMLKCPVFGVVYLKTVSVIACAAPLKDKAARNPPAATSATRRDVTWIVMTVPSK